MSKFKKFPTADINRIRGEAEDHYDDVSTSAQEFLDDIEERVKFAIEEEVEFMELSQAQYDWLVTLSDWDSNRSHFRD